MILPPKEGKLQVVTLAKDLRELRKRELKEEGAMALLSR
jgi:hypothetical protein